MGSDADVRTTLIYLPQKRSSGGGQNDAHARGRHQVAFDSQHGIVHRLNVRTFRRVHVNVELGFIDIARDVFLFDDAIQRNAGQSYCQGDHGDDHSVSQRPSQQPGVETIN